jgi:hypothetical protein
MTRVPSVRIPDALIAEHDELHADLDRLAAESGQIGAAAREVAALLGPHAVREQEFALPPLGLLRDLSAGRLPPDAEGILALSRRLKSELPQMLAEHIAIMGALQDLADKAREMDRPDVAAFAQKLIVHAETEEDVLYPAAILVGDYLDLRLRATKDPS